MHLFLLEPKVRRAQSSTGERRFVLHLFHNWGICASIVAGQRALSGRPASCKTFLCLAAKPLVQVLLGKGGSPGPRAGLLLPSPGLLSFIGNLGSQPGFEARPKQLKAG